MPNFSSSEILVLVTSFSMSAVLHAAAVPWDSHGYVRQPSRAMTSRTCFLISLSSLLLASGVSLNITSQIIVAGSRLALCGYYTISYEMWAQSTAAYLYVTDTTCNSLTASPCQPPITAALLPLSCVDRLTCKGGTSQPSAIPLCLVVANKNATAPLEVNLVVSGSFTKVNSSSSSSSSSSGSSSKGFSTFEVILIVVGSAAGLVVLVGLMSLTSWLMCFKPPISRQIWGQEGDGDFGAKPASVVGAPQRVRSAPAPPLLPSPATVYPYPLNGGAPYGIALPLSPVPYEMAPMPLLPYVSMRSPSALAPLPTEAYSGLSQPPSSPPPLLRLPPRLPPPPPTTAQSPPPAATQSQPPLMLGNLEQQ
ncbi:hypothetical protein VaNZ11_002065 [Volvox africanus]|uniref:Membrane-associated protein n=1 Tax=Volvox africanus TaxID=51714 RepID=A0ABQ5RR09_9CHLO|nr:hypothetical protein VaNZ11_002065 [Volvox africanus]